jgi:hypothetical protein
VGPEGLCQWNRTRDLPACSAVPQPFHRLSPTSKRVP